MAPILSASLALLSISGAVTGALANTNKHQQQYGKHQKLVKRTIFENLSKRDALAPYGYDRCAFSYLSRSSCCCLCRFSVVCSLTVSPPLHLRSRTRLSAVDTGRLPTVFVLVSHYQAELPGRSPTSDE